MKNSNLIQIALDYKKQEQRRENARRVAPVTLLCEKKKILFNVDIDKGITIEDKFFNFDQIEEAIEFVKTLDCKIDFWRQKND